MSWRVTEYLDPKCVKAAIATYNQIRTALEEGGWVYAKPSDDEDSAYWWTHPAHDGIFMMSAAYRQLVIDEREKACR